MLHTKKTLGLLEKLSVILHQLKIKNTNSICFFDIIIGICKTQEDYDEKKHCNIWRCYSRNEKIA